MSPLDRPSSRTLPKRPPTIAWLCLLMISACSYDYDTFKFDSDTSSSTGGLAGAGGLAGSGGQGGVAAAGAGGAGAQAGGGLGGQGGGGRGPCRDGLKPCGDECVAIDDPALGCAAVDCTPCVLPNATATCEAGACAVDACTPGFGDCDGSGVNGCEIDLGSHSKHCGKCGRACAAFHTASLACSGGLCVSSCDVGYANCSMPSVPAADNGCEHITSSDGANCGGCNNACTQQGDIADGHTFVCGGGAQPKGHCGCSSALDCGVAGASGSCDAATGHCTCDGSACNEGEACVTSGGDDVCSCNGGGACPVGQTCCQTPSGCVDLGSNAASCGACGHACPPDFACAAGSCVCTTDPECNAGTPGSFACQAGKCACGGNPCASGERCQPNGACG